MGISEQLISTGVTILAAILGGGGLGAVIMAIVNRRKILAEARGVEVKAELQITDAAMQIVERVEQENKRLRQRTVVLEDELDQARTHAGFTGTEIRRLKNMLEASEAGAKTLKLQVDKLKERRGD